MFIKLLFFLYVFFMLSCSSGYEIDSSYSLSSEENEEYFYDLELVPESNLSSVINRKDIRLSAVYASDYSYAYHNDGPTTSIDFYAVNSDYNGYIVSADSVRSDIYTVYSRTVGYDSRFLPISIDDVTLSEADDNSEILTGNIVLRVYDGITFEDDIEHSDNEVTVGIYIDKGKLVTVDMIRLDGLITPGPYYFIKNSNPDTSSLEIIGESYAVIDVLDLQGYLYDMYSGFGYDTYVSISKNMIILEKVDNKIEGTFELIANYGYVLSEDIIPAPVGNSVTVDISIEFPTYPIY